MTCIYCRARPRRQGIGEGLFCPECEALCEDRVAGYHDLPLLFEARHNGKLDVRDLVRHYAWVAGLIEPAIPFRWTMWADPL